jgi:cobalt-zinc-cadmium resistance protein CzcA
MLTALSAVVRWSLQNRPLVLVATVLFVVLGLRAATQLSIDAVPDVTNVQVQILTDSPGSRPAGGRALRDLPVERAMSGVPEVEEIRSLSKFGLSVVTVVFHDGDRHLLGAPDGQRAAHRGARRDPGGFGEPEMAPISSGLGEIFQFEVRGDGLPEKDRAMVLRDVLQSQIAARLRSVPGVVEINTFGGELRTYQVEVTPSASPATACPSTTCSVAPRTTRTSAAATSSAAGADARHRHRRLYEDLDHIREVVVTDHARGHADHRGTGSATCEFAPMIRQGAVTRDGRGEVVTGIGMMLMGGNSRTVSRRSRKRSTISFRPFRTGVTIEVFYDRTELVERTIKTVEKNLFEGRHPGHRGAAVHSRQHPRRADRRGRPSRCRC